MTFWKSNSVDKEKVKAAAVSRLDKIIEDLEILEQELGECGGFYASFEKSHTELVRLRRGVRTAFFGRYDSTGVV